MIARQTWAIGRCVRIFAKPPPKPIQIAVIGRAKANRQKIISIFSMPYSWPSFTVAIINARVNTASMRIAIPSDGC